MDITIAKGRPEDLDALGKLYDDLNDHLAAGTNYPGWRKGIYPTKKDARRALREGSLFVAKAGVAIAGSLVLNHRPEKAFRKVEWQVNCPDAEVFVLRTFVVHPQYMGQGTGRALMDFARRHAQRAGMRAIRLDVYRKNTPAIRLYERCGYTRIALVDLGLSAYGLDRFYLYEQVV